jgi:hypothetical protein
MANAELVRGGDTLNWNRSGLACRCPLIRPADTFSPQGAKGGISRRVVGESGSVMLEFAIAFPLVLVMMLACIQFSQIWIAKMVVHYGAYCAARTALVCKTDEYNGAPAHAAAQVCDLLRQSWGLQSGNRNTTKIEPSPTWNVTATHTYTLSLITPIVGQIIAWGSNPWEPNALWANKGNVNGQIDGLGCPTITLTETVVLPKPYKAMVEAKF